MAAKTGFYSNPKYLLARIAVYSTRSLGRRFVACGDEIVRVVKFVRVATK